MGTSPMFVFGRIHDRLDSVKYKDKELNLKHLPHDFCPICEYFEDDPPFCCNFPWNLFPRDLPLNIYIEVNGIPGRKKEIVSISCPLQIMYIEMVYKYKTAEHEKENMKPAIVSR